MQNLSSNLQILLARFGGKILIPFAEAALAAGFKEQTARNLQVLRKFPIHSEKRGGRRFIHIQDLADYIESVLPRETKRKPGRPTKVSQSQGQHVQGRV